MVIRCDKSWRWCGGFSAIEQEAKEGALEACVLKSNLHADQIKAAMWFEALQAPLLPIDQIFLWHALVARHLPHDLMDRFFGKRGMTPSSCARVRLSADIGMARMTDLLCDLSNDDRKIARMEAIRLCSCCRSQRRAVRLWRYCRYICPRREIRGTGSSLKPTIPWHQCCIGVRRPASRGLHNGSGCALWLWSGPYGFAKNMPRRIAFHG